MTRKKKNPNLEAARSRMYHDLIFECAERVFAEKGYDESTMADVASEAGVSLKTLYATFPGKTEIYAEIQATRGLAFLAAVQEGAGEGSAQDRLEGGVCKFVGYLIEHDAYRRILLREGRAWGLAAATEQTREYWRAGVEHVAGVLQQGMDEGLFYESDPELLASSVMAVMQVQLAGRLERSPETHEAEQVAEEILVVLRRMLCIDSERESAPKRKVA